MFVLMHTGRPSKVTRYDNQTLKLYSEPQTKVIMACTFGRSGRIFFVKTGFEMEVGTSEVESDSSWDQSSVAVTSALLQNTFQ